MTRSNFVGGKAVPGASGRFADVFNPAAGSTCLLDLVSAAGAGPAVTAR